MSTHEDYSRDNEVVGGSNRGFGLVFGFVFLALALWPLLDSETPRYWAVAISAAFFFLGFFQPDILSPLNRIWVRIGKLMHKVVNPLVLGLMFYGIITPAGAIMRIVGKDPLRLKPEPNAASYWINRPQPGPRPETMKRQF